MRLLAVALIAATSSPALAGDHARSIAGGVNAPIRWFTEDARVFSGSAYVGLSPHDALRVNVATYENAVNLASELVLLAQGEYSEGSREGRTTDVGVGYVYYPRRLFDGFMAEAGLLGRHRNLSNGLYEWEDSAVRHIDTNMVGARAMVGWSWLFYDRVFIAVGVGASLGYEHGTERLDGFGPRMTTDVRRADVNGEGYLRIGGAFDL